MAQMGKRIAVCALHYGAEYLPWAVRGVQDAVDEVHIFYSATPTYGFSDGSRCPESEMQLQEAACRFAKPGKVMWHRCSGFQNEGQHRDEMHMIAQACGAEAYLVFDADEVWDPAAAAATIENVVRHNRAGLWLALFANFWRSWKFMVHDGFRPVRVVDLRHPRGGAQAYLTEEDQPQPVFHFGYAQSLPIMKYKIGCHGHRHEWRADWWDSKFMPWRADAQTNDIHPVVFNLWPQAEPTPPHILAKLDELLPEHPNRGLDLIA